MLKLFHARHLFMQFMKHKLNIDIAWTISSLIVLSISGMLINIFLVSLRDVAALGVFNLTYTVYIISSQIIVMGLHYSVMRNTAVYTDDGVERDRLLFTASILSLGLGIVGTGIVFFNANAFIRIFNNNVIMGIAIRYAALGLLFFPFNKVLFAYLNGLRNMKFYSMLQSIRYIIVMLWVMGVAATTYPIEYMLLGFFMAEFITACLAVGYILRNKLFIRYEFNIKWIKQHLAFGIKSLMSGMFVELNSRVDVLLLGIFLPVRLVGIYSFVVMLVDGLYHLLATIRINFNPVLVGFIKEGNFGEMKKLLIKAKKYIYPLTIVLSFCIIIAFWTFSNFIMPNRGLSDGLVALLILMVGLTLISVYIPFDNLMLASGKPGLQTMQQVLMVLSNVILNFLLVPIFGIEGAALATFSSYLVGIISMFILVRYFLNWNILNNTIVS